MNTIELKNKIWQLGFNDDGSPRKLNHPTDKDSTFQVDEFYKNGDPSPIIWELVEDIKNLEEALIKKDMQIETLQELCGLIGEK